MNSDICKCNIPRAIIFGKCVVVYWRLAGVVWPNYEVVSFQTQSVTITSLGSVAYYYEAIIIVTPVYPSRRLTYIRERVRLLTCTPTLPVAPLHGSIFPPGRTPSLSQHTDPTLYLYRNIRSSKMCKFADPNFILRNFQKVVIIIYVHGNSQFLNSLQWNWDNISIFFVKY